MSKHSAQHSAAGNIPLRSILRLHNPLASKIEIAVPNHPAYGPFSNLLIYTSSDQIIASPTSDDTSLRYY